MDANACLHQVFEQRAREAPARTAVRAPDGALTYQELDERASRLSLQLRRCGVGPDVLVGLCVDRSLNLIVGLLAILKAGGAYVPIDPDYPRNRIDYLLRDSNVRTIVTTSHVASVLEGCVAETVYVENVNRPQQGHREDTPATAVTGSNLAYVIYTSGSTGAPKGVLIEHRSVIRLFQQTEHWFRFGACDVWTLFHSISFDFSVWELWGALLYGGCVVVVPSGVARTPERFYALLQAEGVTLLSQTPSAFRQLAAVDAQNRSANLLLRAVIFGGEALDLSSLEDWMERRGERPALINMYGITETTVHVTYRPLHRADLAARQISPIGIPIPDLEIRLCDPSGAPVPDGTPGEMWIGGAGLARGYLGRPDLTSERFHRQPDGTRFYRSGDTAVRLGNGEFAYVGRVDDQLKIRGFRVEPGEIESCLSSVAPNCKIVVMAQDHGDGDVRLNAHILAVAGAPTDDAIDELGQRLWRKAAADLPIHMRPSAYRFVDVLPMTAQGKVDRAALRRSAAREWTPRSTGRGAASPTERVIIDLAEEILERRGIGAHDDFFDAGGTSLAIVRLLGCINERFQVSLDGSELVAGATVACLAACVDHQLQQQQLAAPQG